MVDFLKMQTDYIERWYKKEMSIGADRTGCAHMVINEDGDALIMVESYAVARIPGMWSFTRQATKDNAPDLARIWECIALELGDCEGIELEYEKTVNGSKIAFYRDDNGKQHGFNPELINRYKLNECHKGYNTASHAMIFYLYDSPVFVILECSPKTIGIE